MRSPGARQRTAVDGRAGRAGQVRLRIPFDSHVLGGTGPLQNYPELRGRPTIVAHPLTKIDGVELATIEPIGAIAKGLVAGERQELGKKKKGGD